jgi:hypothetical protein
VLDFFTIPPLRLISISTHFSSFLSSQSAKEKAYFEDLLIEYLDEEQFEEALKLLYEMKGNIRLLKRSKNGSFEFWLVKDSVKQGRIAFF